MRMRLPYLRLQPALLIFGDKVGRERALTGGKMGARQCFWFFKADLSVFKHGLAKGKFLKEVDMILLWNT